jgi:hypothetical protein
MKLNNNAIDKIHFFLITKNGIMKRESLIRLELGCMVFQKMENDVFKCLVNKLAVANMVHLIFLVVSKKLIIILLCYKFYIHKIIKK